MSKKRKIAWIVGFIVIIAIWWWFGGLATAWSNCSDKWQSISALCSSLAFAGMLFAVDNQNESSKKQINEISRYAEIAEFKQKLDVLSDMKRNTDSLMKAIYEANKTFISQEIRRNHLEKIDEMAKSIIHYDDICDAMMEEFYQKHFKKYDTPKPTIRELLARITIANPTTSNVSTVDLTGEQQL